MSTSFQRTGMAVVTVAALGLGAPVTADAADSSMVMPYLVVTKANNATAMSGAEEQVVKAKGTVVVSYPEIGVLVTHSRRGDFATVLRAVEGVQHVAATRTAKIPANFFVEKKDPEYTGEDRSKKGVPAEGKAWDIAAIGTDQAHKVTTGSRDVVVGVLDSGVDDSHPDLADALDTQRSAGCVTGKATSAGHAWRPVESDHGTHVAGTIAAQSGNGGVLGVAPGVTIAAVKTGEGRLQVAEGVICGFMWAAQHRFKIVNASFFVDPWRFNCPADKDQAGILEAVRRAVSHAQDNGVLVVAAAGNDATDLASKTTDSKSPNDVEGKQVKRTVTNDCLKVPTELPEVVTVSSVDKFNAKAATSDFGLDKVHIAAPGVDIWSTLPGGKYGLKSGTSMAAPHVSGVAALIASKNPSWGADKIRAELLANAVALQCPKWTRSCTPVSDRTSYFGRGLVNAEASVG